MQTRRPLLLFAILVAVVTAIALPVFAAFSNTLSTTAIRDAYFIGNRRDSQTSDFLADYVHQFPQSKSGAYVTQIGIDTPFTQVVKLSETKANYHAPDAEEEFENKPLPFIVDVDIAFTSTYSPIPPTTDAQWHLWIPDFWNDFKVQLIQGEEIKATGTRGGPIFTSGWEDIEIVTGGHLQVVYDPAKITADPINVQVITPDGQTVETTFNLAKLR